MSRRTPAITGMQRTRRSVSRSGIALLVAVTIAMLLLPIDPAAACPTCKDQLAAGSAGLARGFYWSILFMLGMPASILGAWAFAIWRLCRRRPSQVVEAIA
ncbi:MAG TPA: hypothetical protein PLI18_04200 [Pirellulaceae bacterium]|nr:hypothetical protein [Pirellulaceae bacterium]